MRYLIVPPDVQIIDRKSGKHILIRRSSSDEPQPWSISHEDFVSEYVLPHPDLTKGGAAALRRVLKLETVLRGCSPGDVIPIEDADFLILRNVVERVEWAPNFARYAVQMLPHLEAWEKADTQNDAWMAARRQRKVEEAEYQQRVERARDAAIESGTPIGASTRTAQPAVESGPPTGPSTQRVQPAVESGIPIGASTRTVQPAVESGPPIGPSTQRAQPDEAGW